MKGTATLVNKIVHEFEAAWQRPAASTLPEVADFVAAGLSPSERQTVLEQLIATDLEFRWLGMPGHPPIQSNRRLLESYANTKVQFTQPIIAAEYLVRRRCGDEVSIAEYETRFSNHGGIKTVLESASQTVESFPSFRPKSIASLASLETQAIEGAETAVASKSLLQRLISDDLEYRWNLTGDRPLLESYVQQYPELGSLHDLPFDLIAAEYHARCQAGDVVQHSEYAERFPGKSERLKTALQEVDRELMTEAATLRSVHTKPTTAASASSLTLPFAFGGYLLLEELGKGGMGVVYKAEQVTTGRLVALKLIRPDQLSSIESEHRAQMLARFRNEVFAAAKLDHDHVVTVYDVGEVDGQSYYAMQFVDGESLHEKLADGPLEASEAAKYLEQVAGAVAEAHAIGVLHRDLKPHNVMIDKKSDRALLADFGLAKLTEKDEQLTMTAAVLGSPPYMSPEQTQDSGTVTTASDIYGLGATLYHLLTNRPPFQAANLASTIVQIQSQLPVAPRQLNAAVPVDLETICLKCLEKDASKRYLTAGDLADDLKRFRRGEPVKARPVGRIAQGWRWCKRNPIVAALSLCVLLALLIGTIVSATFAVEAQNQAQVAEQNAANFAGARDQAVAEKDVAKKEKAAAEESQREAERQSRISDAYRLASQSQLAMEESPQLAALLAAESVEVTTRVGEPPVPIAVANLADTVWQIGGESVYQSKLKGKDAPSRQEKIKVFRRDGKHNFQPPSPLFSDPEFQINPEDFLWDETGLSLEVMAMRGDGKLAAMTHNGNQKNYYAIHLWDLEAKKETILTGVEGSLESLTFSPDGKWLVGLASFDLLYFWKVEPQVRSTPSFAIDTNGNSVFAFSPSGKWLAISGDNDEDVELWPWTAEGPGEKPLLLAGHLDSQRVLSFSEDSRFLVTGSVPNGGFFGTNRTLFGEGEDPESGIPVEIPEQFYIWNLTADKPEESAVPIPSGKNVYSAVAISGKAMRVAVGDEKHQVHIWNWQDGRLIKEPFQLTLSGDASVTAALVGLSSRAGILELKFAHDGQVLMGHDDVVVTVWDMDPAPPLYPAPGRVLPKEGVPQRIKMFATAIGLTSVALDPHGNWMLIADGTSRPTLVDLKLAAAISNNGVEWLDSWVAELAGSGPYLEALAVHNPRRGILADESLLTGHDGEVVSLAAANGLAVTQSEAGSFRIWDISSRKPARNLSNRIGPETGVMVAEFQHSHRPTLVKLFEESTPHGVGSDLKIDPTLLIYDADVDPPATVLSSRLAPVNSDAGIEGVTTKSLAALFTYGNDPADATLIVYDLNQTKAHENRFTFKLPVPISELVISSDENWIAAIPALYLKFEDYPESFQQRLEKYKNRVFVWKRQGAKNSWEPYIITTEAEVESVSFGANDQYLVTVHRADFGGSSSLKPRSALLSEESSLQEGYSVDEELPPAPAEQLPEAAPSPPAPLVEGAAPAPPTVKGQMPKPELPQPANGLLWKLADRVSADPIPLKLNGKAFIANAAMHPSRQEVVLQIDDGTVQRFAISAETAISRIGPPLASKGQTQPTYTTPRSNMLRYSPDGRWLLLEGGSSKVWDVSEDKHRAKPKAFLISDNLSTYITKFSPTGKWLVVVSTGENPLQLWDMSGERPVASGLANILLHRGRSLLISDVTFSEDEKRLHLGCGDGTVRTWNLDLQAMISAAKQSAGRKLTPSEKSKYLLLKNS